MRVVTRGDMDGLTGSVIVSLHEKVEDIFLIHPQDITAGKVDIAGSDILINVPYHAACGLWFDHHQHTATYDKPPDVFEGSYGLAPSAARLVYEYYGGSRRMPEFEELVEATDRLDSADLRPGDVITPHGYIQLGFTMDGRTGLGTFHDYFLTLFDLLRKSTPIDEILAHPAVKQRCSQMSGAREAFRTALESHSIVDHNVVITDFRSLQDVPIGNRFLVYAVFPEANASVRLHWGPRRRTVVAVIGHSIFNRTCGTDVGDLAARFGGGGHPGAASIPLDPGTADEVVRELVNELREG